MRGFVRSGLKAARDDESGYILFMAILVLFILSLLGIAFIVIGATEATLSKRYAVMDQAYSIADAGVDRALIAVSTNDGGLADNISAGVQWTSTEEFGGDSRQEYTVEVRRNEDYPSSSYYKVITSTGIYDFGADLEAERTIEAKVFVPVMDKDYDASFDYLVYNGNNSGDSTTWPDVTYYIGDFIFDGSGVGETHDCKGAFYMNGSINIPVAFTANLMILGNIVATDNITLQNNWGAQLTNRGIWVAGGSIIAGLDGSGWAKVKAVATGGLTNTIKVGSAAGDTGPGGYAVPLGQAWVMASDDVGIEATFNANWGPTMKIGADGLLGGIKAGNNVKISSTANILSAGLDIGDIWSGGRTDIECRFGSGVTADNIHAGQNGTVEIEGTNYNNVGVTMDTDWSGAIPLLQSPAITVGGVTSRGEVVAVADLARITMGTVRAGNNTLANLGGTGVCTRMEWLSGISMGDITSTGKIDLSATVASSITTASLTAGTDSATGSGGTGVVIWGNAFSSVNTSGGNLTSRGAVSISMPAIATWNITLGNVWCGSNVDLNAGEFWFVNNNINTGTIRAEGWVDMKSGDEINTSTVTSESSVTAISNNRINMGSIYANGNIWVESDWQWWDPFFNRVRINGTMWSRGSIHWEGRANPSDLGSNSTISQGAWGNSVNIKRNDLVDFTDTDLDIGDLIPIGGSTSIASHTNIWIDGAGDWWPGNDVHLNNCLNPAGYTRSATGDVDMGSWNTGDPGLPTIPPVPTPSNPTKPAAPTVGHSTPAMEIDVLSEAGLERPVRLLQPSWGHFREKAQRDDDINGPPAGPAHELEDGGPGDTDLTANGEIHFEWDSTQYSSHETVYNDDAGVTLIIDKASFPATGADGYEGTIVSRGNVEIDSPQTDWLVYQNQTLNLIAGGDIDRDVAGFALAKQDDATFHLYAGNDINMRNQTWQLVGVHNFNGSFTAGNRVYFDTNRTLIDYMTLKWKRWALDPVGWVPPFKIFSWREI